MIDYMTQTQGGTNAELRAALADCQRERDAIREAWKKLGITLAEQCRRDRVAQGGVEVTRAVP